MFAPTSVSPIKWDDTSFVMDSMETVMMREVRTIS